MILIPSLVQVLSRAVSLSCIELEAGKYNYLFDKKRDLLRYDKMDICSVKNGLSLSKDRFGQTT